MSGSFYIDGQRRLHRERIERMAESIDPDAANLTEILRAFDGAERAISTALAMARESLSDENRERVERQFYALTRRFCAELRKRPDRFAEFGQNHDSAPWLFRVGDDGGELSDWLKSIELGRASKAHRSRTVRANPENLLAVRRGRALFRLLLGHWKRALPDVDQKGQRKQTTDLGELTALAEDSPFGWRYAATLLPLPSRDPKNASLKAWFHVGKMILDEHERHLERFGRRGGTADTTLRLWSPRDVRKKLSKGFIAAIPVAP